MRDFEILGMKVAVTSIEKATEYVANLSMSGHGGYVCAANVHMCMESYDDKEFQRVVNGSVLVVPDGKPLAWWMNAFGERKAKQVRGPDLFISLCNKASQKGIPIGLYGGTQDALSKLQEFLKYELPTLNITCAISPPFRELTQHERAEYLNSINESGAKILFLGLGCPKQERWMAYNEDKINAVMIGVGAAFDFYAGTKKIAPSWMMKYGLEWLYRLITEPSRLWKRYLILNPRFIFHFIVTWLSQRINNI